MSVELKDVINSGEVDTELEGSVERAIDAGNIDDSVYNSLLRSDTDIDKRVISDASVATGASRADNIIIISQADYDSIATKDPNTIYFIKG